MSTSLGWVSSIEDLRLCLGDAADVCGVLRRDMERARRRGAFPDAVSFSGGPWRVSVRELRAAGFKVDANRLRRWRRLAQEQGMWTTDGFVAE